MVPKSVTEMAEPTEKAKQETKQIVLQRADRVHLAGTEDIEEYMEEATAIMDSIIKDNELATKLGKEELENVKKFRASNAVHGSNTGVLLEFENTNMSFSFFTHVLRSGLEVQGAQHIVIRGIDFFKELAPEELRQDNPNIMVLHLKNIPSMGDVPTYHKGVAEHYGVDPQFVSSEALVTELAGEKTNNLDGTARFIFENKNNIQTYPVMPMLLNGTQVGTFSAGRRQITIKGKVLCCDASCAGIDNHHKIGCKGKELMEQKQQKRDYAKAKDFDALLKINQAQAQAMRRGFKEAAKAKKLNYCTDFNRKGVPCAGIECKRYPCSEWDELMEGETGETFYQQLPSSRWPKKRKQGKGAVERRALRRAAGNGVIDDDEEM